MKIPESILTEIKESVSIADVVGDYVSLAPKGDRYWGRCPFHQEKTPSFTVTPEKGLFYCFGCQKGGTIFNFIQEIENCSFIESVEILAKKAGIELNYEESKEGTERKKRIELNNKVAASFHYILLNKKEAEGARTYLENRGISRDLVESFNIGWAPYDGNWLWNFLISKNYSPEFLKKSGLFSKNRNYPLFTGRIMFPISSMHGEVLGFGGRTMRQDKTPKYINSPESDIFKKGYNLYGITQAISSIKEKKEILLVEGYTDVMALHFAGITTAVAPLGTAFTENQAKFLKRYVRTAYIMFDGDEAGRNATQKAIRILERTSIDSKVIKTEKDADPADILKKSGVQTLKKILDYSINSIEYIMDEVFDKYPAETPSDKESACWEIFGFIDESGSEIKKEEYLKKLAEKANIEIKTIWQEYQNRKNTDSRGGRRQPNVGHVPVERVHMQRTGIQNDLYLMVAVAANVDYFPMIRAALDPKEFDNSQAKELYILMEENFRQGTLETSTLIEQVESPELQNFMTEIAASGEFADNEERIIKDSIRKIKEQKLINKQKTLFEQIRKAEKDRNQRIIPELQEEIIYIDDELKKLRVDWNVESAD